MWRNLWSKRMKQREVWIEVPSSKGKEEIRRKNQEIISPPAWRNNLDSSRWWSGPWTNKASSFYTTRAPSRNCHRGRRSGPRPPPSVSGDGGTASREGPSSRTSSPRLLSPVVDDGSCGGSAPCSRRGGGAWHGPGTRARPRAPPRPRQREDCTQRCRIGCGTWGTGREGRRWGRRRPFSVSISQPPGCSPMCRPRPASWQSGASTWNNY